MGSALLTLAGGCFVFPLDRIGRKNEEKEHGFEKAYFISSVGKHSWLILVVQQCNTAPESFMHRELEPARIRAPYISKLNIAFAIAHKRIHFRFLKGVDVKGLGAVSF